MVAPPATESLARVAGPADVGGCRTGAPAASAKAAIRARVSTTRAGRFIAERGGRIVVVSALLLFAGATLLSLAAHGATTASITQLSLVPIAVVAVAGGLRAGAAAACAGVGLFVLWTALEHRAVGSGGYLTAAAAFVVVGVLVGWLADERSRIGAADTRWFEMSNDMLVEASLDGYFTRLSDRWEECLGWTREELMSRPFREFIHPDDLEATMVHATALDQRPGEVINFENRYRAKDGSWRWLLWSARSDEHRKYAVAKDITERKALEHERLELLTRVEAMARTDMLTGLPNRRSWEEKLEEAIASARRHGRPLALAMADLDRFKKFNDTHGHVAGDALLAEVAASWRVAIRTHDFLARYGGEEFALLLPECGADEALGVVERLRAATPRNQTCSAGIARWRPGDSPADLVARADAALYSAKRAGRNRVVGC